MKHDFHPIAEAYPMMSKDELKSFTANVKSAGLLEAIVLYEGKVLDGRHREIACDATGIKPRYEEYTGADPVAFVESKNEHRRHMTISQRAIAAAQMATLKQGRNPTKHGDSKPANLPLCAPTQAEAASKLKVSERSVRDAAKVIEDGVPELIEAVKSGEVPVSAAAKVAKLPKAEQKKAVKEGKVKEKAKKSTDETEESTVEPMDALIAELSRVCHLADALKKEVEAIGETDLGKKFVHAESIVFQIVAARKALWRSRPTEDCNCVRTGSKAKPECKACLGTGKTSPDRVLRTSRGK